MVIERYKTGCFEKVYLRYNTQGRSLPEGLCYLNSWVNEENNICFQLMETSRYELFGIWTAKWNDLVDFEIYPID
jgi:hypothetical protein